MSSNSFEQRKDLFNSWILSCHHFPKEPVNKYSRDLVLNRWKNMNYLCDNYLTGFRSNCCFSVVYESTCHCSLFPSSYAYRVFSPGTMVHTLVPDGWLPHIKSLHDAKVPGSNKCFVCLTGSVRTYLCLSVNLSKLISWICTCQWLFVHGACEYCQSRQYSSYEMAACK